ncbi:MAG: hypothetical protein AB1779_05360 [Candidatus Thermoplasmatota archaeon]
MMQRDREIYKKAVEQAWEDGVLKGDEAEILKILRNELGISKELHKEIENEVIGKKRKKSIHDEIRAVFLTYMDGRLITFITFDKKFLIDHQSFSGMFTALQIFMSDVLRKSGNVEGIRYGGSRIIIEHSPNLYLTVIYGKDIGDELIMRMRKKMKSLLKKIEKEVSPSEWDGDADRIVYAKKIIEDYFLKKICNKI